MFTLGEVARIVLAILIGALKAAGVISRPRALVTLEQLARSTRSSPPSTRARRRRGRA